MRPPISNIAGVMLWVLSNLLLSRGPAREAAGLLQQRIRLHPLQQHRGFPAVRGEAFLGVVDREALFAGQGPANVSRSDMVKLSLTLFDDEHHYESFRAAKVCRLKRFFSLIR
jgi:hypothetical protein